MVPTKATILHHLPRLPSKVGGAYPTLPKAGPITILGTNFSHR